MGAGTADPRVLMDRMYGWQRHIYDPTRRYYLLGRDGTVDGMALRPGDRVVEVGCGTGHNLIRLARRYPGLLLTGVDASAAMLRTAGARLASAGLDARVRLVHGLAEEIKPPQPLDAVLFSYALSMIPSWGPAIDRAVAQIRPGGTIHVIDFWDQAELPRWFAAGLRRWLRLFGVAYRPEVLEHFQRLGGALRIQPVARRYAYRLCWTKGSDGS